jgi:hypothetical protein
LEGKFKEIEVDKVVTVGHHVGNRHSQDVNISNTNRHTDTERGREHENLMSVVQEYWKFGILGICQGQACQF